jgi:hypothetical protein
MAQRFFHPHHALLELRKEESPQSVLAEETMQE